MPQDGIGQIYWPVHFTPALHRADVRLLGDTAAEKAEVQDPQRQMSQAPNSF